jgi:hypothetical protein
MRMGVTGLSHVGEPEGLPLVADPGFITLDGDSPYQYIRMSTGGVKLADLGVVNLGLESGLAALGDTFLICTGNANDLEVSQYASDGTAMGLYVDIHALIVAGPGIPWSVGAYLLALRVDETDRLVALIVDPPLTLYAVRLNADKTLDDVYTLTFTLNGTEPASHDVAPNSGLTIASSQASGVDISPDGRYVYAMTGRSDTPADLATPSYTSSITVYKFDLDASPSPTAAAFCQYAHFIGVASTPGSHTHSPWEGYGGAGDGIAVSPDGTKVAIQVIENTLSIANPFGTTTIHYDNFSYYLDIRNASSGALISHNHLADAVRGGTVLAPQYYYRYFLSPSGDADRAAGIEWDQTSTNVYFWLQYLNAANEETIDFYKQSGLIRSTVWSGDPGSSDPDWTPSLVFLGGTFPGLGRKQGVDPQPFQWGPELA